MRKNHKLNSNKQQRRQTHDTHQILTQIKIYQPYRTINAL
ncbi:hypothetical Protein psc5_06280 [Candidatus Phytoplasma solani]